MPAIERKDGRLLVRSLTDGWTPLCSFLGIQEPDEPFPRVNNRNESFRVFVQGEDPMSRVSGSTNCCGGPSPGVRVGGSHALAGIVDGDPETVTEFFVDYPDIGDITLGAP